MPDTQLIKGGTVRDIAEEVSIGADVSAAAAAAAAAKEIEARIIAAHKWPRNVDDFRTAVLEDCQRPGFAALALYTRPVGGGNEVTDFSIRGIEDFLRHFGNIHVSARIVAEDADKAVLHVVTVDVEKNTSFGLDRIVPKTVERREIKGGRRVRETRITSTGQTVYLIESTPDEFRNAVGAEQSKLIRDTGKRLLPRDVLEEARGMIDRTLSDENARDPDAAKKKIFDRFAALGVNPSMLESYLGHPLEPISKQLIADLTKLHTGLLEGDFTWADVMRSKAETPAEGEQQRAAGRPTAKDKIIKQASLTEEPKDDGKK
jgi:hypothetical protein